MMTPWVKKLLIVNVAMFFITTMVLPQLYFGFALVPMAVLLRPHTIVTYMFLHADLTHLFFNMIGLFFFGPRLESWLGGKDFLKLYFWSGIGGAAFSFLFAPQSAVVGASGAVYGVLLAFAMIWPRERIYIWGILPIEAWLLATLLVAGSLWSGLAGSQSNVAHFAHLGGLAFGFSYLRLRDWKRGSAKRDFKKKLEATPSGGATVGSDRSIIKRWEAIEVGALHELNREEVISLLDKARNAGVRTLTVEERRFLDRMAGA